MYTYVYNTYTYIYICLSNYNINKSEDSISFFVKSQCRLGPHCRPGTQGQPRFFRRPKDRLKCNGQIASTNDRYQW